MVSKRLIDCVLFDVPQENISFIRISHHLNLSSPLMTFEQGEGNVIFLYLIDCLLLYAVSATFQPYKLRRRLLFGSLKSHCNSIDIDAFRTT